MHWPRPSTAAPPRSSATSSPSGCSGCRRDDDDGLRPRRRRRPSCETDLRQLIAEPHSRRLPRRLHRRPATTWPPPRSFCKLLASEGLLALAWPKEHGGGGGSVWQQTVLREEMWANYEPRGPQYMGINWVGPAIMRYGTAEQKAKHLSAIASGEVIWCQGFSEPEAGTDLASLRTRAVPDGRRLAHQRAEGVDVVRPDGVVVRAGGLHPPGRAEVQAAQPVSDSDGPARFHRPGYPVDAGTASPQRDVPGRRAGVPRRRARRAGRRLAGDARGAGIRAGRHRPLRAVRVAAGPDASRTRRRLGPAARIHSRPMGSGARRPAGGQADWPIGPYRCRTTPRRVRRPAPPASPPPSAISRSPSCFSTCWVPAALDSGSSAALHGAVEDHWRYAQAATVASGTIEVQRMLVARDVLGEHR